MPAAPCWKYALRSGHACCPWPDQVLCRAAAAHGLCRCALGALRRRLCRGPGRGELQRVAIARALVHRPQLVLADEPTGNLDAETASQVLRLLREQIKANGAAGILVTHSRMAAQTCDRALQLTTAGLRELTP